MHKDKDKDKVIGFRDYAQSEIDRLVAAWALADPDYSATFKRQMLDLIDVVERLANSVGDSQARSMIGYIHRLSAFKPLEPLTGVDSEWVRVNPEGAISSFRKETLEQNIRCFDVYRINGDNNRAYDVRKSLRDGSSPEDSGKIEFPYYVS